VAAPSGCPHITRATHAHMHTCNTCNTCNTCTHAQAEPSLSSQIWRTLRTIAGVFIMVGAGGNKPWW